MKRKIVFGLIILMLLASIVLPHGKVVQAAPAVQENSYEAQALSMIEKMSPEELVGQLLLVSFQGSDVSKNTLLQELITKYHLGGVILKQSNDNFSDEVDVIESTRTLTSNLQAYALQADQNLEADQAESPAIPLFIAISQDGNLYPTDQILSGLTPLPNLMSIGATWNTQNATDVGEVLGNELQSLGINLLLGPSLDVYEPTETLSGKYMASQMFGGNPYWAGILGEAYIQGVHQGSDGQVGVVAKHFPGRGASDRLPEAEIASIRKTLDQLRGFDLVPFLRMTSDVAEPAMAADGLMIANNRYQGLQGNIQTSNRPISFDREALEQLLQIPEISQWRASQGLLVSDDLGSPAIRKMFDPSLLTFDAVQVARGAFLSGSDLLYVDNFVGSGDKDQHTTILKTLDSFVTKYREDQAFKQRVTESVLRILCLKLKLYGGVFPVYDAPTVQTLAAPVGQDDQVSFNVVHSALTLISPGVTELTQLNPDPPARGEHIVFITDELPASQCSTCNERSPMGKLSFQRAVERLYADQAGGQILKQYLSSYSYAELTSMLNNYEEDLPLKRDLVLAKWVIFSNIETSNSRPESLALKRLLAERAEVLQNKKVMVFQFSAPLYLDATEISKVTAYYSLYTKIPAAVEVAARALFQEVTPNGRLPISVPEVNYDLTRVLAADPAQIIPLYLDFEALSGILLPVSTPASTVAPTQVPNFKVGDNMPVRTGVILDRNGHPVPDGTEVVFTVTVSGEKSSVQQFAVSTQEGIARMMYQITTPGLMEVRAASEPATVSHILRLNINAETVAFITIVAPTQIVTPAPEATTTVEPAKEPEPQNRNTTFERVFNWLITYGLIWLISWLIYLLGLKTVSMTWGVRWGLASLLGGLLMYMLLLSLKPAILTWTASDNRLGLLLLLSLGCLMGWGIGYLWYRLRSSFQKTNGSL